MSLLWVCQGTSTGLARAAEHSGTPLILFLNWDFAREKCLYQGLLAQAPSLEDGLKSSPSAVLFDGSGDGELADNLRKWLPVWGAGKIQDDLEHNRGWCLKLLHHCGVNVPLTAIFDPKASAWAAQGDTKQVFTIRGWVNEAIQWIRQQPQGSRWVLKPYDSDSSATTYVSDGIDDMVERLEDLIDEHQVPEGDPFILQAFIPGREVSTEAWISNGKIIPGSFNHTIELKKVYAGDLGPTVGSASSTVWFASDQSPLAQAVFTPKFQQWLASPQDPDGSGHLPYHGPLDLNTIISEEDGKPYFLEATPRMGWQAYYAMKELLPPEHLGEIFERAAQGRLETLEPLPGYGMELTLCIPPYPTTEMVSPAQHMGRVYREILEPATGIEIEGPLNDPRINLIDVKLNPQTGKIETAGTFGQIASISTHTKNLKTGEKEITGLFESIHIPDKFGRVIDGFTRAQEYIPWLKQKGFETPA